MRTDVRSSAKLATTIVVLACAACSFSCGDPVRDDAIAALGPEPGPIDAQHRPGQPCGLCHSERGPASERPFSVAGTIYQSRSANAGANQVRVRVVSGDGTQCDAITNAVGNFWIDQAACDPAFPLVVQVEGATRQMHSFIGRESSCAACHFNPQPASFRSGGSVVDWAPSIAVGPIYWKEQP